jgi:transposase-like protein
MGASTAVLILDVFTWSQSRRRSTTMVKQSVTVADVVAGVRDGRLDDFVREAVALFARELMDAEITAEIGAGRSAIAPAARATYRQRRPRGRRRPEWR